MTRYSSWRREFSAPINALQSELNRLLTHYRTLGPIGPGHAETAAEENEPAAWVPALDVLEAPDEVVVWADLPGVDPAKVELTVTGRVLTIRGEKPTCDAGNSRSHMMERASGAFFRQVPLPSDVNIEAIQAEARDGVLHIRLPKADAVKPRTIPIRPGAKTTP